MNPLTTVFRHALGSGRLIAGIVLLAIFGVFFTVMVTQAVEERRYRSALDLDATVVRKEMRPATSDSSTAYELTYALESPEGYALEKTERVKPALWDTVAQRSIIRVQYLAGQPESIRLARNPRDAIFLGVAGATGPFALLGAWLIAGAARDVWRKMRIYQYGHPAEATVTAVRETNLSINRRIQWAIDFTFRDPMGQEQRGASAPMPYSEAQTWADGDKGIVRFDPARPADHVWIGR